jgi:hypothetical protein
LLDPVNVVYSASASGSRYSPVDVLNEEEEEEEEEMKPGNSN